MASDSDDEEDFVTYGTPLEPLEEDEPIKKPIPIQEQTVKDEKGRYQRFHGAFTGGFSAGYFNTVGSKEGWAPSTFISSRNQKAERQNVKPEDFMDEEDFGEHGIAPKEITTTADFASGRPDQIRAKARAISSLTNPIPGDTLLEELIAPARSSFGVLLLRKMGWKDGQGVGPRLKRKQRKQNTDAKVYGCPLPPAGSEESEDDDEFAPENVTFAPKDVIPIDFTPKDGLHGLGYHGLDPLQALTAGSGTGHIDLFTLDSDRTSGLFSKRKAGLQRKGGISGQGFGVGAMEEEDDDIYHKDAMSNYDVILGDEEPGDGLYGWTAPQQYGRKKNDSNREASYLGKILQGFTLASRPAEVKSIFPPPILPRDYRPVHYFRPVVDPSSVSPLVAQALQSSRGQLSQDVPQQGRHTLDSTQRRDMLGETSLQGPSSVFDLMTSRDRERLSEIRKVTEEKRAALQDSRFHPSTPKSEPHAQRQTPKAKDLQANLQVSTPTQQALSAWSSPTVQAGQTFKPFEKNPEKQARYDLYISHLKQGNKDALDLSLDPTMTEWERGREREEFFRSAVLYKPSNSSLSSRFTRAKQEDDTDKVEVARDQESDVNDKQTAVKMKMFGKLTRDTLEWHPDKMLCKRFNVPDPYPGSSIVGMPKIKRDKFSVFNFLTVIEGQSSQATTTLALTGTTSSTDPSPTAPGKRSRWDVAELKNKESSNSVVNEPEKQPDNLNVTTLSADVNATPELKVPEPESKQMEKKADDENEVEEEEVRPPMDLFKAIFASSSDEKSSSSEEESDKEEEHEIEPETLASDAPAAPPVVTLVPPASSLNNVNDSKLIPSNEKQKETSAASLVQARDPDCEVFGPRLPPPGQVFAASTSSLPGQEEKRRKSHKEKHKSKKEHKHKKEKKHKKSKKHKHKGKEKDKKKKKADDSDSDDTDDSDVMEVVSTQDLLYRLKNLSGKK